MNNITPKKFDVYGNTQALDEITLNAMATRLEDRGRHPTFLRMLHEYLDYLNIDSITSVIDLGCGTGFVAREIYKRSKFNGQITGIDISPHLIEQAIKYANSENSYSGIEFHVGDSVSLKIKECSFDVVIAHTLISHLTDPEALLLEMRRLAKPGGIIAIFDGDYASLTFSNTDLEKGKAMDELIINSIVAQPRVMRQLPLLLANANLELSKVFSYVVTDVGKADFWESGVESMRKILPAAKRITAEDVNTWADNRNLESEKGTFFASSNFYSYLARKPR